MTEEFVVERTASHETRPPDLVLFINGIPVCVIECKRPDYDDPIGEAISQHLRNQRDDEIPRLFLYSQLLVGISKNDAAYATTGTPAKFWSVWKENVDKPLQKIMSRPPKKTADTGWLMDRFTYVSEEQAAYFTGSRAITGQDRALYSLCRPDRLLELMYSYTVFDAGEKKVARYQQFFTVRNAISRIDQRDDNGARKGGVVWHTQGSGKSLTMVMLAKEIARLNLPNYKIVLVTDRVDLDDQIYKTFAHCDMEPVQATTGKHLASLMQGSAGRVITTVIDKFDNAVNRGKLRNESDNVFVLVDESHRGQYKTMHAKMREAMPRGCFIGFTGTAVRKKEKDTINKFGGLIQPTYSIRDAVEDKAVVPLLYEGRDVEQRVDKARCRES